MKRQNEPRRETNGPLDSINLTWAAVWRSGKTISATAALYKGGHMFQRDLLKTWYPSVLCLQLTASPPARTVAPAAGRIPACAARASRAPAARRWLRSRCTSAMGAVWGAYSRGSTFSRKTNSAEGPQKRLLMLLRCRPRDLRPPGSQSTPCKCYPSFG